METTHLKNSAMSIQPELASPSDIPSTSGVTEQATTLVEPSAAIPQQQMDDTVPVTQTDTSSQNQAAQQSLQRPKSTVKSPSITATNSASQQTSQKLKIAPQLSTKTATTSAPKSQLVTARNSLQQPASESAGAKPQPVNSDDSKVSNSIPGVAATGKPQPVQHGASQPRRRGFLSHFTRRGMSAVTRRVTGDDDDNNDDNENDDFSDSGNSSDDSDSAQSNSGSTRNGHDNRDDNNDRNQQHVQDQRDERERERLRQISEIESDVQRPMQTSHVRPAAVSKSQRPQSTPKTVETGIAIKETAAEAAKKQSNATRIQVKRLPNDDSIVQNEKAIPTAKRVRWKTGVAEIFVKCLNILFPLFYIALATLHILKAGYHQYDFFPMIVQEINTIAITLWPIMFASVATQSLRAYGAYQAERGIKLINLEQVLHSTSFSSAFRSPLTLRRIDLVSIILFVLWAVSPLASQGLLRMPYVGPGDASIEVPVSYANGSADWTIRPVVLSNSFQAMSLFGGALMSPNRIARSAQDLWGYPRIPRIDALQDPNADGWYEVVSSNDPTIYSSLLGILHTIDDRELVNGLNYSKSFNITTAYWNLTCLPVEYVAASQLNLSNYVNNTVNSLLVGVSLDLLPPGTYLSDAGFSGVFHWALGDTNTMFMDMNFTAYNCFDCSFKAVPIEAQIDCFSQDNNIPNCQTSYVRQSSNTSLTPGPMSPLFTSWFAGVLPASMSAFGSLQQGYIDNPLDILGATFGNITVNAAQLSTRTTQLVNTFYQAGGDTALYTTGVDANTSGVTTITGVLSDNSMVWKVSIGWMVLVYFSSIFILALAIADVFWESKTISPNFLGFVSSMVRNSKHLRKEIRGRELNGPEKARAMAELTVMLQDINADGEHGKIALAPTTAGSIPLHRDRSYK